MLPILAMIGTYVAFAGFFYWLEDRDDKKIRGNRIAYNPKTGKYAYEYSEDGKSTWVETP
jgi:hypothetical protein